MNSETIGSLLRKLDHWVVVCLAIGLAAAPIGCKKKEAPPSPKAAAETGTASAGSPMTAQVTLEIGSSSGLHSPRGVAVDRGGNIWVTDSGNNRVLKFDASGKQLLSLGQKGTGPGQFTQARMALLSPQGDLFVLDSEDGWIEVFSPSGKFSKRIGGQDLSLYHPAGFAMAPDGTLYVADTGGNRILPVAPDGKPRDSISAIGPDHLSQPSDVCVDSKGGLYVYQTATPKSPSVLYHLTQAGALEAKWAAPEAPSTLDTPRAALAADGRVFLTDPGKKQIRVYDTNGSAYHVLEGADLPRFQNISGVAIDPQGRLYVSDAGTNAVYRLQLSGGR